MMTKTSGLEQEGWRPYHAVAAVVLIVFAVLASYQGWADMLRIAMRDEECGHALLAVPAFIWLVWVRRRRLRRCQPTGRWLGTVLIGIGWLAGSIGFRHPWELPWHSGALLMVIGALITAVGSQILWEFLAAFGVLLFIIPVPGWLRQGIAIPLQGQTAHVTQLVCETLGMTVERAQSTLSVHGVKVAIAEACNGMRMVFALVMVCYIFAFVTPLRSYVRFLLLVFSPVVAMVANIVRLVPTVWVYDHFSEATGETFHDISGWVMLVAAFLTLLGFLRLLRWAMMPVTDFRLADVS
jgi:exosortase